jgi:cell pole-organizing protein PopZ
METTIKEIAALLRSTEHMAAQFAQRVEERVGQPVSHEEILAAMQKISAKSLTMEKVVAKVRDQQKRKNQRASQRRTASQEQGRSTGRPTRSADTATAVPSQTIPAKEPKTILERLEVVLQENWDRGEAEGLHPDRISAEAFLNAVYHYTDRREATRQRILQAARQLNQADVLLTPALVADVVHELFQS